MNAANGKDIFGRDVETGLKALNYIAQSYGLKEPFNEVGDKKYIDDLIVIHRFGALARVTYDVLGGNRKVLFRHDLRFDTTAAGGGRAAPAELELPMLPPGAAQSSSCVISTRPGGSWDNDVVRFARMLQAPWRTGTLPKIGEGSTCESSHQGQATRGRSSANLFTADEARSSGVIVRTGDKYSFIKDDRFPAAIFAHHQHVAPGTPLKAGQRLSYVVIAVPRGLQARAIRVA